MVILEQNFKWHLEAFASELFKYHINKYHKYHEIFSLANVIVIIISFIQTHLARLTS